MIRALSVALLLLMTSPTTAQLIPSLVDRYRVLLVFSPTTQDPRLQQQLKAFNHHAADLRDRDLLIIPVIEQPLPPIPPETLRLLHPPAVSPSEQLLLRTRFHIAPADFTAILLGKDGGEKLRATSPIPLDRLNHTIDAMPTRREEMKQKAR